MPYEMALSKLRSGEIEEVYEIPGIPESFKGVRLCEKPGTPRSDFYRPTLDSSDTAISPDVSLNNAGFFFKSGPKAAECVVAHDYVCAYPYAHDNRAVVISAGLIHGATIVSSLPA